MLLDAAINKIGDDQKKLKELREKTSRRWPSYRLLEEIRKKASNLPLKFATSTFAFAEITSVILSEYVSSRLYDAGVPFLFWEGLQKQEKLSEKDEDLLIQEEIRLLSVFMNAGQTDAPREPLIKWADPPDFVSIPRLITSLRISTTDAFLVAQASQAECAYFVTEDKTLRKLLKPYEKLKPLASQTLLGRMKSMPR
jgi:hypothetical protein